MAEFTQAHGGDPQVVGLVFARVFDALSQRRTRIIDGIGTFSLGQIALSEKIDSARGEMGSLLASAEPDHDRIDALEEQIDWEQMIFSDRQQSITYLCETPVLLERRLFAVAQLLQAHVNDGG